MTNPTQDLNVLALVKDEPRERYLFMFNDSNRDAVLQTLGRFASNHDLSFTWYDAMKLSKKVRDAE